MRQFFEKIDNNASIGKETQQLVEIEEKKTQKAKGQNVRALARLQLNKNANEVMSVSEESNAEHVPLANSVQSSVVDPNLL